MKDINYHTLFARKQRIQGLLVAGYTVAQIMTKLDLPVLFMTEYFAQLKADDWENRDLGGVCFGVKREAYYPPDKYPEHFLIKNFPPVYDYEDLSESEKEIYDKIHPSGEDWRAKIRSLKN